ncbi:hypothetical protein BB560_000793 [Smittium megazygosporum]|uniref:Importin N-terminal domain-containing protein n=1 Tax=Smittium megazygosporum TaxID=133381 RepID=A0A2T9ZJE4_9FUNG|nr:hypothetical protein BB560_000793 [Smittium megazygosporum]
MNSANPNVEHLLPVLQSLLQNLLSSDNAIRSQAESSLNQEWALPQPDNLLVGLSYIINQAPDPNIRGFASVLLRRVSLKENFDQADDQNPDANTSVWFRVSADTKNIVKTCLLNSLENEQVPDVRNKVCDSISDFAYTEALLLCSSSPNPALRESAYRIFAGHPLILSEQDPSAVKNGFLNAFQDPENNASIQVLMVSGDLLRAKLEPIIPQMLSVLESILQLKDETGLVECLSSLTELVETYPTKFRAVLPNLLEFVSIIYTNPELDTNTKQVALELLVTFAEASPGLCRKQSNFCEKLIPIALDMMTQIEDDEAWYTIDDLDDTEEDEVASFGEQFLDRLACSIGGKQLLPIAFNLISPMLTAPEWQKRHAALMAIAAIGEGCHKIMKKELASVINLICQNFKDPHPRVRYASCHAIGQLSTDFSPTIQDKYHSVILQHLIPAMDDVQFPRVQAHAAAAMVNFSEEARKSVIEPYLDVLFERLMKLLTSNKQYVQEQSITSIAIVAESAQDLFRKHYNTIFPQLINALQSAQGKELRLFRGKTMECATFIASAVGYDTFKNDSLNLIDIFSRIQSEVVDDDDPQISYLIAAWARLCKIMGTEFLPYLPTVMVPLLKSASLQPDFAVVDSDVDTSINYSSEDGWEFTSISGQQVGIRTSILEEKCTAIEMIVCYARELGPGFEPYAKQVLDLVLPLLKFYFHEGVKYASAAAIPKLMESMKSYIVQSSNSNTVSQQVIAAKTEEFKQTWGLISAAILKAIPNEMDNFPYISHLFQSFSDCVEIVGEGCLSDSQLDMFFERVESILTHSIEQIDSRIARLKSGEDYEEDEAREITEEESEESEAMDSLSRAMRMVLKTCPNGFISRFDKIIPTLVQFSKPEYIARSKVEDGCYALQWFLCVFDDLIELAGPVSWTYSQYFLQTMINSLDLSFRPDVRQGAAFGIGAAAQFGGSAYSNAVVQSIPGLANMINDPEARSDDNIYATENATSALVKILINGASSVPNFDQVLLLWFTGLPIINDEDEAIYSYNYLLQILQDNATLHKLLANYSAQENANLPRNRYIIEKASEHSSQLKYLSEISNGLGILHLVNILVDVLVQGILQPELADKLASALKSLVQSCPEETQSALWVCIDTEKRHSLSSLGYA